VRLFGSDKRSREVADALHQLWGIAERLDFVHDRAADNGGIRKTPDLTHLRYACSSKPPSVLLERIEQQLHNGKKGVTKWWKVGKSGKK
jgi:hypothetical protein